MRICIIGCGAVGSLFAAHLAKAGEAEIWAYDVWKEHTDAIREKGLRLTGAAEFTARMNATSDASEIPLEENMIFSLHPQVVDQDGRVCLYTQDTYRIGKKEGECLADVAWQFFSGQESRTVVAR